MGMDLLSEAPAVPEDKDYSNDDDDDNVGEEAITDTLQLPQHSISGACYPLPPPLAQLLQVVTIPSSTSSAITSAITSAIAIASDIPTMTTESPIQALTNLMDNSITAMDQWYFGNLPSVRRALKTTTA
jgi:hypothetical protein